jgi:hypothetical protein
MHCEVNKEDPKTLDIDKKIWEELAVDRSSGKQTLTPWLETG